MNRNDAERLVRSGSVTGPYRRKGGWSWSYLLIGALVVLMFFGLPFLASAIVGWLVP